MIIIDLSYCSENNDDRLHHGGGHYGFSAARYINSEINEEIALLIRPGFDLAAEGLNVSNVRAYHKEGMQIPAEFDKSENIVFLPIPYPYIKNNNLPKKARIWATVHGLRNLELLRLAAQSISNIDYQYDLSATGLLNTLKFFKRRLRANKKFENELLKLEKYKQFLKEGHKILTVSEHTKWTLSLLGVSDNTDSISVAYPLYPFEDHLNGGVQDISERSGLLFLSAERKEKNLDKLIMAIKKHGRLMEIVREESLVITGSSIPGLDAILNIPIKHLGYCSSNMLGAVFSKSRLLIYTSINEGFGIPPVQAFRAGLPVLASPNTAISEICGDAAVYANPFDYGEIAVRLYMLLNSPELRDLQVKKGYKRYDVLKQKAFKDWNNLLVSEGCE